MNKRLLVSMPLRSLLCFVFRLIRRFPFAILLASLFRASFASPLLFGLHTSPFSPLFASPFAPLCALLFVYRQSSLHGSHLACLFGPVFAYSSVYAFFCFSASYAVWSSDCRLCCCHGSLLVCCFCCSVAFPACSSTLSLVA
jgi:hypothetical protein